MRVDIDKTIGMGVPVLKMGDSPFRFDFGFTLNKLRNIQNDIEKEKYEVCLISKCPDALVSAVASI